SATPALGRNVHARSASDKGPGRPPRLTPRSNRRIVPARFYGETAMKVGTALNMLCQPGRSDASVVGEHLAMGDLAEPLGFDSLFALEHHFTGYAMSPAPAQLLSYYAGRTKRITLGTAVIVLPGQGRRGHRAPRHFVWRAVCPRLRT